MKKLAITAIMVFIVSSLLGMNAYAQQRMFRLWGEVTYSDQTGVGSGKPVEIWLEEHPQSRPDVAYTDSESKYRWGFSGSQYFYKVRCRFQQGGSWYSGETIIDDILSSDTRVDITVYEE